MTSILSEDNLDHFIGNDDDNQEELMDERSIQSSNEDEEIVQTTKKFIPKLLELSEIKPDSMGQDGQKPLIPAPTRTKRAYSKMSGNPQPKDKEFYKAMAKIKERSTINKPPKKPASAYILF
jgi:hypothetical protein